MASVYELDEAASSTWYWMHGYQKGRPEGYCVAYTSRQAKCGTSHVNTHVRHAVPRVVSLSRVSCVSSEIVGRSVCRSIVVQS